MGFAQDVYKRQVIYFIADTEKDAPKLAGQIRTEVATRLDLIDKSKFEMCFICLLYTSCRVVVVLVFVRSPPYSVL